MTKNPHAQNFMEFVAEHSLSLYKIAKLANISEGTLRAFRDTPGRHLSAQNFFAVANALEKLTGVKRDYFSLFHDGSLNLPPDYTFFVPPTIADRSSAIPNTREPQVPEAAEEKENAAEESRVEDIGVRSAPTSLERLSSAPHGAMEPPRDLPVFGTTKVGDYFVSSQQIGFTVRPPSLIGNADAYALYAPDDSMAPRIQSGELLYLDPHWPTQPICDVVVKLKGGNQAGHWVIASLAHRENGKSAFTFYRRQAALVFEDSEIAVHKVLCGQELIVR